jgi:WD40 repeat protein
VALSADGRRAASAGDDARVLLWDVRAARLLRTVAVGAGIVDALALSDDGSWLATGGADGRIRVWELATNRLVVQLDAPGGGGVRTLAFGAGAGWLAASGGDARVHLWALPAGRLERSLTAGAPVSALAFAEGGTLQLSAGLADGRVMSWPLAGMSLPGGTR